MSLDKGPGRVAGTGAPGWLARFEAAALQAPTAPPGEAGLRKAHAAWLVQHAERLRAGIGCGPPPRGPASRRPMPAQPFAEFTLDDAAAGLAWPLAQVLARQLDGSLRLEAMSQGRGLAWRVQVKLADAAWWRQPQPADPWDAGWAIATPAARTVLADRFVPRRTTLVLASQSDAQALGPVLAAVRQRSARWRRALRWLWVPV